MRAFPSAVFKADAIRVQQQLTGSSEFSELASYMTTHKLVILDEINNLDKPLSPGSVNGLTAEWQRVRLMKTDALWLPRTANLFLFGGGVPATQTGQGSDTRFRWAYRPARRDELPEGLNNWMRYSPDAPGLFAAYIVRLCAEVHVNDDTDTPEARAQATEFLNDDIQELIDSIDAVMEYTGGDDDFVSNADLWERLNALPDADLDRKRDQGTRIQRAVSHLAQTEVRAVQPRRGAPRGYVGWRLREPE